MSSQVLLPTIAILLVTMASLVFGGCSFKDHMESTQSSFQDLDQAKLAAKMALAHKGLDIEVLKKRQASIDNETTDRKKEQAKKEIYIPTYVTAENKNSEEDAGKKEKTVDEFEGDIWTLAGRSNSHAPKQDLGQIKTEL